MLPEKTTPKDKRDRSPSTPRASGRIDLAQHADHLRAATLFLTQEEATAMDDACPQWRRETPPLASASVDLMAALPDAFAGLPFRAQHLRAEIGRVRDLERACDEAEAHFLRLRRALWYRQSRLASWTAQIEERLRTYADQPLLRDLAQPLLGALARLGRG